MERSFKNMSAALLRKFIADVQTAQKARLIQPSIEEVELAKSFLNSISSEQTVALGEGKFFAQYLLNDDEILFCVNWDFTSEMARAVAAITEEPIEILDIEDYHLLLFHLPLCLGPLKDVTADDLEEHVIGPAHLGEAISLSALRECTEHFSIFKTNKNSRLNINSPERIGYFLWTFLDESTHRSVSSQTLTGARELLLTEHRTYPINNIRTALTLSEPKYVFLEFYRSLELIYSLPRAEQLLKRLGSFATPGQFSSLKIEDFARFCADELGWRRVERDSVARLVHEVASSDPQSVVEVCEKVHAFGSTTPITENWTIDANELRKFSDALYDIRNQVAHQFLPDQEKDLSTSEYQKLTEFVINSLQILYSRYQSA